MDNSNINLIQSNNINDSPNVDVILMEKDKQIINLTKITKDLNNQIENLIKQNQSKDYEIITLKTDLASMESDKNIYESKIEKMQEKINVLQNNLEIREKEIEEISSNTDNKINEINSAFNIQLKDYQNAIGQSQSLERQLENLANEIIERDKRISVYQQIIFDLKRENKKIITLMKENNDKEDIINELSEKLNKAIKDNEKLSYEYNLIAGRVDSILKNEEDYQKLKNNVNNFDKIITSIKSNYKDQIIEKDRLNKDLNEKLCIINEDYNQLIEYIIEQVKYIEKCIENNTIIDDKFNSSFNNLNNSKYSLIKKNFQILIKRILEIRKNDMEALAATHEMLNNEKDRFEIIERQLQEEKNGRINERNDLFKMETTIQDKMNEIKNLNQNLSELVSKIDLMHKENLNIGNEYSIFKKQINNLCDEFISMLSNFNYDQNDLPKYSMMDSPDIKLKNLLLIFEDLISKFNNLNESLSKSNMIIQSYQNKINELSENNNNLKEKLNDMNRENQNKSHCYESQNEDMNLKLRDANYLLEESKKEIKKIQQENYQLKQQNLKLEKNLQMITQSHEQMENKIYMNNTLTNEKLENSQLKANQLLKELEIKDRQIKSLENYISQINSSNNSNQSSNSPYMGKIITKEQFNNIKGNNNININNNLEEDKFIPNAKNERELNNLLNKFNNKHLGRDQGKDIKYNSNDNIFNDSFLSKNKDDDKDISSNSEPKLLKKNKYQN